jgi:hypothetical protein
MYNRIMEQKEPGFKWTYAVTSEKDRIFPAENLKCYWENEKDTRHIILPMPHYLFHNWSSYTEFIDFVENYKLGKKRVRRPSISTKVL